MKKIVPILSIIAVCLSSCVTLQPTIVDNNKNDSISNYKYFYVNPAGTKTGSTGYVTGNQYGVYGSSTSRSVEPCDVITSYLINKGYVRIATIDEAISDKTLVISYGDAGSQHTLNGYVTSVTLQFTSAKTHDVVCNILGEGMGDTEADGVRHAIKRCLNAAFGIKEQEEEELDNYY